MATVCDIAHPPVSSAARVTLALMEWETSLVGRKIGRVHGVETIGDVRRGASVLAQVERHAIASEFSLITSRVDVDHVKAVWALEAAGFVTADVGVTFEYDLAGVHEASSIGGGAWVVREADRHDVPALQATVNGLFLSSYYYVSQFLSRAEADLLYRTWIGNCVLRGRADRVLVADVSGTVAGFITCRRASREAGVIELVGVSPKYGSRGIGKSLVHAALDCFRDLGAPTVRVRTQVTNLAAVNLYSATGARLVKVDTTFIKPLDDRRMAA
jgi:dTDP-4-amino-4,6-dideoxy-D-galactose acyltransferase